MTEREELRYLADLFDDPDEVVSSCVDKRIAEMGHEVIPELERMRHNEPDPVFKRILSDRILRYNAEFRTADLRRYALHEATQPTTLYEGWKDRFQATIALGRIKKLMEWPAGDDIRRKRLLRRAGDIGSCIEAALGEAQVKS